MAWIVYGTKILVYVYLFIITSVSSVLGIIGGSILIAGFIDKSKKEKITGLVMLGIAAAVFLLSFLRLFLW